MAAIEMNVTGERGFKLAPFKCPGCGTWLFIDAIAPNETGHEIVNLAVIDANLLRPDETSSFFVSRHLYDKLVAENSGLRAELEARRPWWKSRRRFRRG